MPPKMGFGVGAALAPPNTVLGSGVGVGFGAAFAPNRSDAGWSLVAPNNDLAGSAVVVEGVVDEPNRPLAGLGVAFAKMEGVCVSGADGSGDLVAAAPNSDDVCCVEGEGFVPLAGVAFPNRVEDWKMGAGFEVSGSGALGPAPNKAEVPVAGVGAVSSFFSAVGFGWPKPTADGEKREAPAPAA